MPGKVYYSQYSNFTANVRHELTKRHPVTGDVIEITPAIRAEFGQHLGEFTYMDPLTGAEERGAEIRGHYFDSAAAQAANNWTDEEREMVERRLDHLCESNPDFVQHHSEPAAAVPWPTYDAMTNYLEIASFAEKAGLLSEALVYERQNKNRDGVVKALEAKLADKQADETLVAA